MLIFLLGVVVGSILTLVGFVLWTLLTDRDKLLLNSAYRTQAWSDRTGANDGTA